VQPPHFTSDGFVQLVEIIELAAQQLETHEGGELLEDEEKPVDIDLKMTSVSASEERRGWKDKPACSNPSSTRNSGCP
jgi:hypothetical protein